MKKYLKMVLFVVVYIIMPLVIDFSIIALVKNREPIKSISMNTPTVFFGIFDVISSVALFLFVKYVRREDPIKFAEIKKIDIKTVIICAVCGLLMASASYSIISTAYFQTNIPQIGESITWLVSGNVLLILYIVLVNSFYKEFCFRGLAFNEVKLNVPIAPALIIQAVFYSLEIYFQMDMCSTVYAFIGQLIFGLIYYFGKSLWASYLSQLGCTYGLLLINRTALSNIYNKSSAIILLIVSICLLALMIVLLSKNKRENIQNNDDNLRLEN